ncbi:MAG TPA: hypothetical protein VIJ68_01560 [Candidatus Saccharimonadales bacterium]
MAQFTQAYSSERPPEDLWRAIHTPLLDPDLASLVHEGLAVSYKDLHQKRIDLGTLITYVPLDAARQKVPVIYRAGIPRDVEFFVTQMSDGNYGERHDVLQSDKANGWVNRKVEAEGEGSRLVVAAELVIDALGGMFEDKVAAALEYTFGQPSQNTIDRLPEILAA